MKNKVQRLARRKVSNRSRLPETGYRLLLSRSSKYLFAQVIDLETGKTLLGLPDKVFLSEKKEKLTKTDRAGAFGELFAKKALEIKIKKVVFDRGGHLYHGRVKAFAQGARKGGLEF
jgi:large subunit ribosomal protein L18